MPDTNGRDQFPADDRKGLSEILCEPQSVAQSEVLLGGVQDASCAAYILKNDGELSLLCANSAFYALVGCTSEEMRVKYGNCLGALIDAESLHSLTAALHNRSADNPAPLRMKLRIKRRGAEIWLHTEIFCSACAEGTRLHCFSFDITQYEQERHRFSEDEESLRLATGQLGLDYFEYDLPTGAVRLLFAHAVLPTGIAGADGLCPNFVERLIAEKFICAEYADMFRQAFQDIRKEKGNVVCELQVQREDRDIFWVRLSLTGRRGGPASRHKVVCTLEDITSQKEASRNYLNETRFYQAMLAEKTAYAQVDVTMDKITRIGGMWNLYNEIIDKLSYSTLVAEFINKVVHPEDRSHYLEVMQSDNFIQSQRNGIDRLGCDFRRIVDQNKMMWMQLNVHLFVDPLTQHLLALISIKNINEKKQREISLLRDSRLDQLTSVFNRKSTENLVREYLAQVKPEELSAFVMLDIDDFKVINDTRGHRAGDQVLVRFAHILRQTVRREDVIGRFGGDEFILFFKNIPDRRRVEERLTMLYSRLNSGNADEAIACSIGVALAQGAVPYEQLFQRADIALYHAKDAGKNCFHFYRAEMQDTPAQKTLAAVQTAAVQLQRRGGASIVLHDDGPEPVPTTQSSPFTFDAFLAEQGDIAYLVDPETFDLICGNKAFYDRLGVSEAQCVGIKCYEIMHKRETPCPFCGKVNWSTDKFYIWKNVNRTLEQEFLIKNKLVSWRGREGLLALAVDISNNKSIVDSIGNGTEELHGILSGVQRMTEAPSLPAAMTSVLESIGFFFLADTVRFWRRSPSGEYACAYAWTCKGEQGEDCGTREVNGWLNGKKWSQPVMLENPEAMLCYSYEMYHYMKSRAIRNQRWLQIRDRDEELGCISIDNVSGNFLNIAFLESFSVFIAVELRKRTVMENALYADRNDVLTDLLSRKSFESYMSAYCPDGLASLGVAIANFNNLKGINSAHGFQTGNYFIRQFADMLRSVFVGCPVFRLNGDEFLAVVPEVTRTELEDKLLEVERCIGENGAFTVSLGYSWDDVEKDPAILIEQATVAMKVNKKRFYDAAPASDGAERRRLLSDLMAALDNREFEVFLQPKVEMAHMTVVGAEALIRFRDKDLGIVPPSHFIDKFEKNNLIRYIDLFVFEEVCRLLEKWKRQGLGLPVVSLNFSRLTLLERNILASMEDVLSHYDAPRTSIEIEITESVADMGKSILYQTACELHKANFSMSLDDFGTKYTNLAMLAELNFSKLKLDRSLIARLGDRTHTVIMKNIIRMCDELGIVVVAEGIETKKQEHILREMHCSMGQGYLYGQPMSVGDFERKFLHPLP